MPYPPVYDVVWSKLSPEIEWLSSRICQFEDRSLRIGDDGTVSDWSTVADVRMVHQIFSELAPQLQKLLSRRSVKSSAVARVLLHSLGASISNTLHILRRQINFLKARHHEDVCYMDDYMALYFLRSMMTTGFGDRSDVAVKELDESFQRLFTALCDVEVSARCHRLFLAGFLGVVDPVQSEPRCKVLGGSLDEVSETLQGMQAVFKSNGEYTKCPGWLLISTPKQISNRNGCAIFFRDSDLYPSVTMTEIIVRIMVYCGRVVRMVTHPEFATALFRVPFLHRLTSSILRLDVAKMKLSSLQSLRYIPMASPTTEDHDSEDAILKTIEKFEHMQFSEFDVGSADVSLERISTYTVSDDNFDHYAIYIYGVDPGTDVRPKVWEQVWFGV